MKNILIVVAYSSLMLWFAFTKLSSESSELHQNIKIQPWQNMKEVIEESLNPKDVDLYKIASIYGVDYQELQNDEGEVKKTTIQLHLISIHESGKGKVARIKYLGQQGSVQIHDYILDDDLLGYQVAEITEKEVLLLNNLESFSLKPFSSKKLDVKVLLDNDVKVADENN